MKRFLFVIVCLVVVSAAGFAQRNDHRQSPEERAQRMTEWMTRELQLTPEQVVPIDSINLVFAKAQAELFKRAKDNDDSTSMREDMRKLQALRLEAYEKVLTDEQLETYKKLMEERMQNRGNRGHRTRDNSN